MIIKNNASLYSSILVYSHSHSPDSGVPTRFHAKGRGKRGLTSSNSYAVWIIINYYEDFAVLEVSCFRKEMFIGVPFISAIVGRGLVLIPWVVALFISGSFLNCFLRCMFNNTSNSIIVSSTIHRLIPAIIASA